MRFPKQAKQMLWQASDRGTSTFKGGGWRGHSKSRPMPHAIPQTHSSFYPHRHRPYQQIKVNVTSPWRRSAPHDAYACIVAYKLTVKFTTTIAFITGCQTSKDWKYEIWKATKLEKVSVLLYGRPWSRGGFSTNIWAWLGFWKFETLALLIGPKKS